MVSSTGEISTDNSAYICAQCSFSLDTHPNLHVGTVDVGDTLFLGVDAV